MLLFWIMVGLLVSALLLWFGKLTISNLIGTHVGVVV